MPIFDEKAANAAEILAEIDLFVANSPHGMLMQSPAWAKVKANWNADYIYLRDEAGKISAVLSIISIKQADGTVFMYAPRGPVCDLRDTETVQELLAQAAEVAQQRGGFLLRIDPEVAYEENLVNTYRNLGYVVRSREIEDPKAFSNPRCNMVLDLNGKTHADFLANLNKKVRYRIRRTYTDGLTTNIYGPESENFVAYLDQFYALIVEMAARQGISHRPKAYFEALFAAFPSTRLILTLDPAGEPISAAILTCYNRKAFYIYAGTSTRMRELSPSLQTNNEGIKYAIENGYLEYDMGGVFSTDPANGLYQFKRQLCGETGLRELIGEIDVVYNQADYDKYISKQG
ncbi:aminoacyltransferase [Gleimia sp. 6138-11-ORH1]|uniref:lipid II:glycine glycyltransferase FemX n=1 Tax=Gleimia sp. 6138-11-ORH1 TaxID=2973937 RepID=UPI00216A7F6C|nr:aminoacyltransferase [Gleimia sp. 6138-11-ORH1]MCS4484081.1 aminoacyltransferase [Gleimia sp. 6138-11-ORH1]